MRWIKSRLAIRQTAYAVLVVALLGSAITTFEIISAYEKELNRLQRFNLQVGEAFSKTAARAAFHVDQAQAESVLEGLMNFENVSAAQINTDLGDILGARSRTFTSGLMDPLSRWLFSDVSSNQKTLVTSISHVPVGTLTLTISPEQSGRGFIGTLGTNLSGLAIEFILLTSTLAFIFHLSLVKPLTAYTTEIEAINHDSLNIPDVGVPVGHETDELGQMVLKTNQLISRIAEQREALIHREKIAALGTMLTSAAHELNNPLAVISAQTQILKETSDDPAIIARADRILRPVKRCARIIQSFLEIARQRKLEKRPMRIEEAIGYAV
jgi:signal transduction histidine kinase